MKSASREPNYVGQQVDGLQDRLAGQVHNTDEATTNQKQSQGPTLPAAEQSDVFLAAMASAAVLGRR